MNSILSRNTLMWNFKPPRNTSLLQNSPSHPLFHAPAGTSRGIQRHLQANVPIQQVSNNNKSKQRKTCFMREPTWRIHSTNQLYRTLADGCREWASFSSRQHLGGYHWEDNLVTELANWCRLVHGWGQGCSEWSRGTAPPKCSLKTSVRV